jgi:hypothetical protein
VLNSLRHTRPIVTLLLIAAVAIGFSTTATAAGPPTVKVALTGDPVPGATVTAKATVTINDGSALISIRWSQKSGIPVQLNSTTGDTITVTLPSRTAFKNHLIEILEESPIPPVNYPDYIPPGEFYGGLQDRFTLVGVAPLAHEHSMAITFNLEVVTSSGTYVLPATIEADLPWPMYTTGLANVAVGTPVLLHGKEQATYNWTLTKPTGSSAALFDATGQNPDFIPDVPGAYKVTVTDLEKGAAHTIDIVAGTWSGIIVGQDSAGNPVVDANCKTCHVGKLEKFTAWSKSGHAEIFTDNVNNPAGHYSEACVSCHTVGYDTTASNNGIDDQDDWAALKASGMLSHGATLNWTNILSQMPKSARMANIQCENCHGPQNSEAHAKWDGSRTTLSAELCGTCHGEPARHGRFQQWQLSRHGNFETARAEGTNAGCAKCHSAQGFVQWAGNNFDSTAIKVTWDEDTVHPISCAVCHDPHNVGTTSGDPTSDAPMRMVGQTPMLDAGFVASNVGNAAICMSCHNGRRGLKNDTTFNGADLSRAPHVGPQTDILMGQNLYFAKTGTRGFHSMIEDSCITCHMQATPPPADLSYNLAGTNHTFFASKTICANCHENITAESIQGRVETKMEDLKHQIETALLGVMKYELGIGNKVTIGTTTVTNPAEVSAIEYIESHGRQGANVSLSNGTAVNDLALNSIKVQRATGTIELLAAADPSLAKAGWNYWMVHSDKSHGVHNPTFVLSALDVSLFATQGVIANIGKTPVQGGSAAIGGGLGNGAGAINCTTPYVYWTDLAGHLPGNAGSEWRTDLIARNLNSGSAAVKFYLHGATSLLQGTGTIDGKSQKAFEDVVGLLGGQNNLGALEICSDRPLLVMGRIFNQAVNGTFGQNIDGHVADLGYGAGQTVSLLGMRQLTGEYRTNLSVTNAGKTGAVVKVTLFDAAGTELTSYNLNVTAGQVIQDGEPFRTRANKPDIGWGFATVTVLEGSNIRTMASMIDMKTNDPTTIMPKQ